MDLGKNSKKEAMSYHLRQYYSELPYKIAFKKEKKNANRWERRKVKNELNKRR